MKEVNKSIPKVDGYSLVLGKPVYTDDLAPKGALIVKVLRSPHPFARIKSINTAEAKATKGVECILTYKDIPRIPITRAGQAYLEQSPYDKFVLDEYVRHVGDDVAIIAAIDEKTANRAMNLIKVDYEVIEPVNYFEKATKHKSIIHPENDIECKSQIGNNPSKNIAASVNISSGDIEKSLDHCDVVVKETYYTQATAQSMLETFRSVSYLDHQGRLVVITSTQIPFHIRRFLSRALNLPINRIRVIKPRIGGGFGAKQTAASEFYPAFVTHITGKPAKISYTRKETFEAGTPRHPMKFDVTVGSDNEGNIKAIDIEGISDTGAYGEHSYAVFLQAGMKPLNLYNKIEASRFKGNAVYTNHTPSGAFRGYGATQGIFAVESAVNELAQKLNLSPIEIRIKNMIKKGEKGIRFDFNGVKNTGPYEIIESCELDYCINRGKELIGWDDKYPRKVVGKNKVRAVGMAIGRQGSGIAKVDMGSATINFNEDGTFTLLVGATDLGTGSDTILSQICADALDVSFEKINIYSSDTDVTPFDGGAYASSTTYVTGNAVKDAGHKMKKLIEEEGAKFLGIESTMVNFDGEFIKAKGVDLAIDIKDFAQKMIYSRKQLTATSSFVCHKSPPPYMAGFAEVEVNLKTGKVDVVSYVAVLDIGTVVNPNLARIQAEGGIVQGIGMALYEEANYSEEGRLINNSFLTYKLPTRMDVGNIVVEFADSYEPTGPFGAKSVGEVVINTSCPAIANAIYNATGINFRKLPITPEKVLMTLKSR